MEDTREVPRGEWQSLLTQFSDQHRGWLIDVEVLSVELGAQPEIVGLPLVSVEFEPAGAGTIRLSAGRSPSDHVTRAIDSPAHLWIERTVAGADNAISIESADGTRTLLRLRVAAMPETVDGVAAWP